jgi:hypothetical protein
MTTVQQPAPTFEDVWRTRQEIALLNKETERPMKGARVYYLIHPPKP